MNSIARFVACLGLIAACGRGEDPRAPAGSAASGGTAAAPVRGPTGAGNAALSKPYTADIDRLCNAVALAGAADMPVGERALPIANWLAANLTTPESRQFLVRIQPLTGQDKADALEAEATRVGLSGCPLAAEWRPAS